LDAIDTSKTHRFYLLLKERITSGALPPGQRLPSEPALAASHGLSRVTIRRALDGLSRDGLITRQPGSGTFVTRDNTQPPVVADLSNMLAHLVAMGRATRVKLLAFAYVVPPPHIAAALQLRPGQRTQHSLRVRYMDDAPFSLLSTHVPERIGITYSESDLAKNPLLDLLERSGVVAGKAGQTISATLAGPDVAEALDVEIGSPLLSLTRIVLGADGRGIEHLSALYRPDRHVFRMEMLRTGRGADRHWRPTTAAPPKSATQKSTKPTSKQARIATRPKPATRRRATPGRRRA
jgi:GntR family transcriptional regulator